MPNPEDSRPYEDRAGVMSTHDSRSGDEDGARRGQSNRLAYENSPYLLQHARNPVDWYPWGNEAFEAARRRDKPIFLSIGYSTCHWCHVMERESFEDEEVARLMNEAFVSIKVDREERPDVDKLYMTVCQLMGRSCGWPLNVLLTPHREPFLVATYIPRESRFGRHGMLELVPRIAELWATDRTAVVESAGKIAAQMDLLSSSAPGTNPDRSLVGEALRELSASHDRAHGGFGEAPKFPSPHNLIFLVRQWYRTGDSDALAIAEHTLQSMRRGGVYDHVGYGFHRYSTDPQWKLPHFEKMLYDQAMLAMAYTETYQATGNDEYAATVREVFTYLERDMLSPAGAFFTAEDADSEGEEGLFYVWTESELDEVLGDDAQLAKLVYNTRAEGNFAEEATGRPTGNNVLYVTRSGAELASQLDMAESELAARVEAVRQALLERRRSRARPLRDDKILTDWNGLVIAAYSRASRALVDARLAEVAERAAQFVLEELVADDGRLLHSYRDGDAAHAATVDDYAFLTWGLIELYQTTFDTRHLQAALELNARLVEHFWDDELGGFFYSADYREDLFARTKESFDGAIPSGNSVAMMNLLRLARITGDSNLEKRASDIGRAFGRLLTRSPAAHTYMLSALDFASGPAYEVVVVGDPGAADTRSMLQALAAAYVPNKVVVLRPLSGADLGLAEPAPDHAGAVVASAKRSPPIEEVAPLVSELDAVDGRATAYVCRNHACELPTTDTQAMLDALSAG